ncbi:MAG: acyloxyacyl hydrolase [Burkholderiales bacterium]|nr:acyloxyacyl hydrolase [Burkholderiales bacterium]
MLLAIAGRAAAVDAVSFSAGRAPGVSSLRAAAVWAPPRDEYMPRWLAWTGADPRFELGLNVWHGRAGADAPGTLLGVGALPMLRWTFAGSAAGKPFVDFGVGPRLWTGTRIAPGHRFGTAFEFGTVIGAGVTRGDYDFFVRFEHTSNGSIKQPNPGINFVQIGLSRSLGR